MHLGAFAVVVLKRPFSHSRVGKADSFQPFHVLPVLVFPVSGFQRFPAFALAVTFFGVSVTSEKCFALREVGFFGLAAAPAIQKPVLPGVVLRLCFLCRGKPENSVIVITHKIVLLVHGLLRPVYGALCLCGQRLSPSL